MPTPIGRRVLIKLDDPKEKKGIIIDDLQKEIPTTGVVEFVGSEAVSLKPGDRVLLGEHYPSPIKIEGKPFVLTIEDNVLVILD